MGEILTKWSCLTYNRTLVIMIQNIHIQGESSNQHFIHQKSKIHCSRGTTSIFSFKTYLNLPG